MVFWVFVLFCLHFVLSLPPRKKHKCNNTISFLCGSVVLHWVGHFHLFTSCLFTIICVFWASGFYFYEAFTSKLYILYFQLTPFTINNNCSIFVAFDCCFQLLLDMVRLLFDGTVCISGRWGALNILSIFRNNDGNACENFFVVKEFIAAFDLL